MSAAAVSTAAAAVVVVVVVVAITSLSPAGDNITLPPRNFVTLNTRVTRV